MAPDQWDRNAAVTSDRRPSGDPAVLMGHCYYRDLGGENLSFEAEAGLLESNGHRVVRYTRDNREIEGLGAAGKARLALRTVWATDSFEQVRDLAGRERPDVAHFQNTFPLISPSAYRACRRLGIPVVQTLRNYRLVCPTATFFRDGRVCEDCMGKTPPWPGVVHACYRDSRAQTGVIATMVTMHRALRTWQNDVDLYVVPTEFGRRKFIEAGLSEDHVVVKPNFVDPDPGQREGPGDFALFVGRLSEEKGILTLLEAWRRVTRLPLRIVGKGPLSEAVAGTVARDGLAGRVEVLGSLSHDEVFGLMRQARLVVFPSEWYETFGRVAVESFACGVPVVAARLGAMAEVVDDGRTGLHFMPGDAEELAARVDWLLDHPEEAAAMGREARREYESRYTAARNYEMLVEIYRSAMERAKERRPAASRTRESGPAAR